MQFYSAPEYQPHCAQLFESYKNKIQQLIPFARVEHIGSSAIPNAISKGDLDIYIEVSAQWFLDAIKKLQQPGFKEKPIPYVPTSYVCCNHKCTMLLCKSL